MLGCKLLVRVLESSPFLAYKTGKLSVEKWR